MQLFTSKNYVILWNFTMNKPFFKAKNDNFQNLKTGVFRNILPPKILSIPEISILFNLFLIKKNYFKNKKTRIFCYILHLKIMSFYEFLQWINLFLKQKYLFSEPKNWCFLAIFYLLKFCLFLKFQYYLTYFLNKK